LVPHGVPSAAAFPVSLHVAFPPEHDVVPTLQGLLAGTQVVPEVQGPHAPSLQ
jgi:hypothetical protein